MVDGKQLSQAGFPYIGRSYDEMDCQKFVEICLHDCGDSTDLSGSNAWYRRVMKEGWVGTPEECVSRFGQVPPGAFLFILEPVSASTPAKYRDDGIGDATHIGLVTGVGKGAIHSSHSKGGVCESAFSGKTVPHGGWNRVGLWDHVDYHIGTDPQPGPDPTPTPEPEPTHTIGMIVVPDGTNVITRKGPGKNYGMSKAGRIQNGELVTILGSETGLDHKTWYHISWTDRRGATWVCWVMGDFVQIGTPEPEPSPLPVTYMVTIYNLSEQQAKELASQWPEATWQRVIG